MIALWSALAALLLLVLIVGSVLVGALLDHGRRIDRLEDAPRWEPIELPVRPVSDTQAEAIAAAGLARPAPPAPADRPAPRDNAVPVLDPMSGIEVLSWRDFRLEREHFELSIPDEFLRRLSASEVRQDLLHRLGVWLDEMTRP